jgi:voltage-gated potassium channel Kch
LTRPEPNSGAYRLRDYYFFAPLVLAAIGLGVWGFAAAPAASSCHAGSFGDALFRTFLLVTRSGSNCTPSMKLPIPLLVAQFLLPLLAVLGGVFATVKLAVRNIRHDAKLAMVRSLRRHTIVCGLGETGLEAVRQLANAGGKLVAVCLDPSEPGARLCERLGVTVVPGDATLPKTLAAAGIFHARAVVMCTGSDARNMEICLTVDAMPRGHQPGQKLFPEVRGWWLLETLEAAHTPAVGGGLELLPFRANQIIARTLLRNQAFAAVSTTPVLLFAGFGDLAQCILRQAILSNYALPGIQVRAVTLTADAMPETPADIASWRHFVTLESVRHRFCDSEAADEAMLGAQFAQVVPDLVVITLPDDDLALQTALLTRRHLDEVGRVHIPVFVRVRDRGRLSLLLAEINKIPSCADRICGFGDLAAVVSPDALFDEPLDVLARAVHQNYLENAATESSARVPWEILAERYRRSNRAAADHIDAKLRHAGYRRVTGQDNGATLDADAIEAMARAEHFRWRRTLQAAGWRQGETRSDLLRTHPLLLPWEDLQEPVRQTNRDDIAAIPAILALIGCVVART